MYNLSIHNLNPNFNSRSYCSFKPNFCKYQDAMGCDENYDISQISPFGN